MSGLRTPDAIHAATSFRMGCLLFVTNDRNLSQVPDLHAVMLEDG